MAGVLAQQMAVGQTAEELAQLDQQACPVCGITFYEFRSQGRLGCPHDYVCFQAAAGAADREHPRRDGARGQAAAPARRRAARQRTQLIRLRREMKEAIDEEDYERASQAARRNPTRSRSREEEDVSEPERATRTI